ncbi:MAG: XdhC family protein [Anaerolineaceae bacterium]|nr:XdhC family protein [Anaerolineaceae bacterium]
MASIYRTLAELEEKGETGVLCTIIKTSGSTPRHAGSRMLVYPDGSFISTIGGGEMESRILAEALDALKDRKSRILQYNMVDPQQGDPGVCGGHLEVFVEPILPRPLLVVIGGGHVGKAVAHLASWLGFRVAVSDDRPEMCTPEVNPDAEDFCPVPMVELPKHLNISKSTYLVLTTRGVEIDIQGLPALLDTQAGYIGVIGSRRRWQITRKALLEMTGMTEEKISRVHSPLGLDLKAETPEEIALSIMAEIIMLRKGGSGKPMKG